MLDHAQLHALLTIERERSFVRAADKLNLSRSALSDRIKAFEVRVGTLLVRRTRPVEMTETGTFLCRHAETIEQLEFDTFRLFSVRAALEGGTTARLRVLVDTDSLATWFADVLREEAQLDDPRLFEVTLADPDHSLAAMRQGHALTAVSGTAEPIHGYKSRPLGRQLYRAVASPDLAERYMARGIDPDALSQAPCICTNAGDRMHLDWMEGAFGEGRHVPMHVLPSARDAVEMCRAGLGWTLAPEPLVRTSIEDGSLADLAPAALFERPLYWHVSLLAENAVQAFTRRVVAAAQHHLAQTSNGSGNERVSRPS